MPYKSSGKWCRVYIQKEPNLSLNFRMSTHIQEPHQRDVCKANDTFSGVTHVGTQLRMHTHYWNLLHSRQNTRVILYNSVNLVKKQCFLAVSFLPVSLQAVLEQISLFSSTEVLFFFLFKRLGRQLTFKEHLYLNQNCLHLLLASYLHSTYTYVLQTVVLSELNFRGKARMIFVLCASKREHCTRECKEK